MCKVSADAVKKAIRSIDKEIDEAGFKVSIGDWTLRFSPWIHTYELCNRLRNIKRTFLDDIQEYNKKILKCLRPCISIDWDLLRGTSVNPGPWCEKNHHNYSYYSKREIIHCLIL